MSQSGRATVAAIALTTSLVGCSAGSTSTQPSNQAPASTVTVALSAPPASLDFTTTSGAAIPQALMGNVYETLVTIDQDGNLRPGLASSWETDGKVTTFHLHQNVRFSNGEPFNAASAKFSIERVLSDAWTNGSKSKMELVSKVEALDEFTLRVTLKQRSNTWLWNMGTLVGAMMTPGGVDQLATNPVGTGPYVVDQWAVGTALALRARDDYWGDPPRNQRAVLRYISDPTTMTNAVRTGAVDAAVGLQAPELLDNLRNSNLKVQIGTTNGEVLLSMNNRRAPFNDLRVRRAVMYGVDRRAVIDTTWEGHGVDTGGAPVAPTDPWFKASERFPYDPQKARALMEEAGAVGTPITLSIPSLPYATQASELLYSQLKTIGFEPRIEINEFPAVWLSKVLKQHDYDMSLIAHVEARDVPSMFGNPGYYLGFDDPTVRDLLAQADAGDEQQYVPTMHKVIDRIVDQAAADTLYNLPSVIVSSANLTGLPVNAVGDGLQLSQVEKDEP